MTLQISNLTRIIANIYSSTMAQVTVYLPKDVLDKARRRAKRDRKSLSAFLGELVRRETTPRRWPEGFVDLLTRGSGDLVEPEDLRAEDVSLE